MPTSLHALDKLYSHFENELPILSAGNSNLHDLARFNGNKTERIHRWFVFKEGFSLKLLDWICSEYRLSLTTMGSLLDPFCGVGTSLLSAQLSQTGAGSLELIGVERNPFIAFVAKTKLDWPRYSVHNIECATQEIVRGISTPDRSTYAIPLLSTIRDPKVFDAETLHHILQSQKVIERVCGNTIEKQFFLLGWLASIEPASGVRRYGRGLCFAQKSRKYSFPELLITQWKMMLQDLKITQAQFPPAHTVKAKVIEGDGRKLSGQTFNNRQFDLIIYSPPYPNNIDYSEVYKMELFFAGYVNDKEGLRKLRFQTLRSHPSIRFRDTDYTAKLPDSSWVRRLRKSLLEAVPSDRWKNARRRLVQGYIDDMYKSLERQYEVAKPGALVACAVGNSLHGKGKGAFCIAADLVIASIALSVGFKVAQVRVLRGLERQRGTSQFLRESVLVLRKPKGST